ncbi:paired immunoglobulin-like type 2 receptor alpha [Bombina bombina]|uniref:paired immunoglobulin-like type 2 receptor alpha n=1 Tax=Bombina bombina TaxID=8345 RepID=UPI00235ACB76|nr:paired immunoglobulin-like type 2 receptor alpha [Bombina bombina]
MGIFANEAQMVARLDEGVLRGSTGPIERDDRPMYRSDLPLGSQARYCQHGGWAHAGITHGYQQSSQVVTGERLRQGNMERDRQYDMAHTQRGVNEDTIRRAVEAALREVQEARPLPGFSDHAQEGARQEQAIRSAVVLEQSAARMDSGSNSALVVAGPSNSQLGATQQGPAGAETTGDGECNAPDRMHTDTGSSTSGSGSDSGEDLDLVGKGQRRMFRWIKKMASAQAKDRAGVKSQAMEVQGSQGPGGSIASVGPVPRKVAAQGDTYPCLVHSLYGHLKQKVVKKIQEGKYINVFDLSLYAYRAKERAADGSGPKRVHRAETYEEWLKCFRVLAACYVDRWPLQGHNLFKYQETVEDIHTRFKEGSINNSAGEYCVDQPLAIESLPGESVTIPCKYSYPSGIANVISTNISWRTCLENFCNDEIYNNTRNFTVSLSLNAQAQEGAVTIKNITSNLNFKYCCRIRLDIQNGKPVEWQHPNGTRLTVKGENLILDQPSYIAVPIKDSVTIPCHYRTGNSVSILSLTSVQWSSGDTPSCTNVIYNSTTNYTHESYIGRISPVEKGLASIYIKHVKASDNHWYCCRVEIMTTSGKLSSTYNKGTQVIAKEPTNILNVTQTEKVISSTSFNRVTISCNFIQPKDKELMSFDVYWMAGKYKEDYVYHHKTDFIHPLYKGKTQLVNKSHLLLEVMHDMDNTTFYCRVVIRKYLPKINKQPYFIDTLLAEGPGTLLKVYDTSSHTAVAVGCVVALLVFFLIGVFYILKRKGANKQETSIRQTQQVYSEVHEEIKRGANKQETSISQTQQVYSEVPEEIKREHEDSEYFVSQQEEDCLLYASVEHSAPEKRKLSADPVSEIVYAVVKRD